MAVAFIVDMRIVADATIRKCQCVCKSGLFLRICDAEYLSQ